MRLMPFLIILGVVTFSCKQAANSTKKTVHKKSAATRLHEKYYLIRSRLVFPKAGITVPAEFFVSGAAPKTDSAFMPYVLNERTDLYRVPDDQLIVPPATQCRFTLHNTKFFLNAASTLTLTDDSPDPDHFTLTGELNIETGPDDGCTIASSGWQVAVARNSRLNIMAYDNEPNIIISLGQGSATVYHGADTNAMNLANDVVVINKSSDRVKQAQLDYDDAGAWTAGRLIGRDQPLAVVCRQLERLYDVPVVDLKGDSLHAFYSIPYRIQTLDEIITSVADARQLSRDTHNDSIFLTTKQ